MEKYINEEGKVGILYSSGWRAGWSTYSCEDMGANKSFLVFDKTLVELALQGADTSIVETYLESKGVDTYLGGWSDIKVEFVNKGTAFLISEYDGYESIEYFDEIVPFVA